MKWYLSLNINQRIWLKDNLILFTGLSFSTLVSLFGFKQTIDLIYEKIKSEGFEI